LRNGNKYWCIEGIRYTEEEYNKKILEMKTTNPVIDRYGNKCWFNEKGELHREDGPAIEYADGNQEWYQNGELHRLDGAAIITNMGDKYWFIEGMEYDEEDFNKKISKTEQKVETTMKDIMKDRFEKAAYRSASRQMVNGISKAIVLAAEKKGMDSFTTAAVGNFFETELGEALIGAILGVGIPYIPKINKDKRALKLAEEFQIESISTVTDTVLDEVFTYVLPVMKEVLNNLPAHVEEENEEEESVVSYSSSTAKA
jgi:hypothetical protein